MMKMSPAVFAVGNNYQIMVPVTHESLMFVRVGSKCYYDESNGIMRSLCPVHRMTVPMSVLDRAGRYTVCERELIERKPYFPTTQPLTETTFAFRPIPEKAPRAIHIADAHNCVEGPVAAARQAGPLDFLILNGDIPNDAGNAEAFDTIYEIAAEITKGEIPTVFARGNHDNRGFCSEAFADYTPNDAGNTYYTFRLGSLWGLVLDCGEDKPDDHEEYGYTVSCRPFRQRQIRFLEELVRRAEEEYLAQGVTRRVVFCHVPFMHCYEPPFDTERPVYREWCRILREQIHPDLVLCGHTHRLEKHLPGEDWFEFEVGCPVLVASATDWKSNQYVEGRIVFDEAGISVQYTDNEGRVRDSFTL